MLQSGELTHEDVGNLKIYALIEYHNPNFDLEDESPILISIGTFILWLGWYFFNGGTA